MTRAKAAKASSAPGVVLSTADLTALVVARHDPPPRQLRSAVCFREVSDAAAGGRRADVIAVQLWHSHGYRITGFEVKRDRSDWLRELKDLRKADAFARHCDEWIVVANPGIVQRDELPDSWGLWEPGARALATPGGDPDAPSIADRYVLRTVRAATVRAERPDVERSFAVSLFRRAAEGGLSNVERAAIRQKAEVMAKKRAEFDQSERMAELADLKAAVSAFQTAAGVTIDRWDAGRVGAAVREVLASQRTDPMERLRFARDGVAGILAEFDRRMVLLAEEPAHNG